jgi:hypothetical protein
MDTSSEALIEFLDWRPRHLGFRVESDDGSDLVSGPCYFRGWQAKLRGDATALRFGPREEHGLMESGRARGTHAGQHTGNVD